MLPALPLQHSVDVSTVCILLLRMKSLLSLRLLSRRCNRCVEAACHRYRLRSRCSHAAPEKTPLTLSGSGRGERGRLHPHCRCSDAAVCVVLLSYISDWKNLSRLMTVTLASLTSCLTSTGPLSLNIFASSLSRSNSRRTMSFSLC